MKRGFTLIELLVVVLIIGILAAIAVPQYQKAVLKSRFSSLMPLAKALNDSEEAYYLEHGTYTEDKTKLDVTTNDTNAQVTLGNEELHQYVKLTRSDIKNNLVMYQKHSPNFAGETHCEALIDDTQANWLCKDSLKGTFVGNKFGYSIYSLGKDSVGSLGRIYNGVGLVISERDACKGISYGDCRGSKVTGEGSSCISRVNWYICIGSSFSNGASCLAESGGAGGCANSTFLDTTSCVGEGYASCWEASFRDQSSCIGNTAASCARTKFSGQAICYANVRGACSGSTYEDNACCVGQCPTGVPVCS